MSYFTEGNNYYIAKEYEKAIKSYNISINTDEEVSASYYNAGVCFIKLKDFDNAIKYFQKAIALKNDGRYYFNLAYSYSMKQELRTAYNYFKEAKRLNPDDKDCDKGMNLILSKHPEYADDKVNIEEEIHIKDKESLKETDVRKLELITEDDNKITLNILEKQRELIEKINEALDNNDKETFIKLSKRLNKLLAEQKEFSLKK